MNNIIEVDGLIVTVPTRSGRARVVEDLTFAIKPGEKVAIVGESGSGKSLAAFSLMRLVKEPVRIESGIIRISGVSTLDMQMDQFRVLRGREIAMIYQDPMSALNPIMRIGDQLVESIRLHRRLTHSGAKSVAIELLESVGIPEPIQRFESYPFELSGGMLQRVMIAIALSGEPKILIADEATTALDVTTQERVLDLLNELAAARGLSILLITHDLGVAAEFSDRIIVLYSGRVVEEGKTMEVFSSPKHPYTIALLNSRCDYTIDPKRPIDSIKGQPPQPESRPKGCVFSPRCSFSTEVCDKEVPKLTTTGGRSVACLRVDQVQGLINT